MFPGVSSHLCKIPKTIKFSHERLEAHKSALAFRRQEVFMFNMNMKIIKPPASLEYTEVTEPVAQTLRFKAKVFLRVFRALQGAARVVKFIFS